MSTPQKLATAQWATQPYIAQTYRYQDGAVWLGRSDDETPLGYSDDRHVTLVCGSRGGKGTSCIVNTLCLWPGSTVVVDPKGENATVTAARRGPGGPTCDGMGQAVHVLDPFEVAQVDASLRSRFNPFDTLDPNSEKSIDGAARLADAIVIVDHNAKDPFWDESARDMIKALILHILTSQQFEGRRNLVTLRRLVLSGEWEAIEDFRRKGREDLPSAQELLWTRMTYNPAFGGLVAGLGGRFKDMMRGSDRQFEGVLQAANRNTEFIDSPALQRCVEASDFQLSELKTLPQGLSLYLCLPQYHMDTHHRWLRMIITLTVGEMQMVRGRPATGNPVLMILDEFAGLQHMRTIETAVPQIAGFGVKMLFVLQSLEQLKGTYKDKWETFLGNSGLKLFFNVEDNFSREYISKQIGDTEIMRESRTGSDTVTESRSSSKGSSEGSSESESHGTGRSSNRGKSESESTSGSHGVSETEGKSTTLGSSFGHSYGATWSGSNPFHRGTYSAGSNNSTSSSSGRSHSQTVSDTHGWSQGTTDSVSEGESETHGRTEGRTRGTTHSDTEGSSRGRTTGSSEAPHKRPLVSPDEVGRVFASLRRSQSGYPGLGLVLVIGDLPLPVRRVNYYEDHQFIGCFAPHPDHAFKQPVTHHISIGMKIAEYSAVIPGITWKPSLRPGMVVARGDVLGHVCYPTGEPVAPVIAPRGGKIGEPKGLLGLAGSFFSEFMKTYALLYYEDGAAMIDPFAELDRVCHQLRLERAGMESIRKILANAELEAAQGAAERERQAVLKFEQVKRELSREINQRKNRWLIRSIVAAIAALGGFGVGFTGDGKLAALGVVSALLFVYCFWKTQSIAAEAKLVHERAIEKTSREDLDILTKVGRISFPMEAASGLFPKK